MSVTQAEFYAHVSSMRAPVQDRSGPCSCLCHLKLLEATAVLCCEVRVYLARPQAPMCLCSEQPQDHLSSSQASDFVVPCASLALHRACVVRRDKAMQLALF